MPRYCRKRFGLRQKLHFLIAFKNMQFLPISEVGLEDVVGGWVRKVPKKISCSASFLCSVN